ncbi:MAG: DUF4830 domain-containing protein [Chitinophagaceae bacterium]
MDTTITLTREKKVFIRQLDAEFTLISSGRKSYFQDGRQAGEMAYCEINVVYKGQKLIIYSNNEPLFLDSIQVSIIEINPWGAEEKGLPAGACKLKIAVSPAIAFLRKYNWTADTILNQTPLELPEILTGLPWYHYNIASTQIGIPLDSLRGKYGELQTIRLREKGPLSGQNLFAHIVIIDDKAVTGWLSAAEAAPGIGPLNMDQQQLKNW